MRDLKTLVLPIPVFLLACSGGPSSKSEPPLQELGFPVEALRPLAGCSEVEVYVRERLREGVNASADALENAGPPVDFQDCPNCNGGASTSGGAAGGGPYPPGPKHASGTNDQVAGVDEADIVKNDGKHIYLADKGAFRVVRAWPAHDVAEIAHVALPGEARKLLVEGDRAVVFVAVPRRASASPARGWGNGLAGSAGAPAPGTSGGNGGPAEECTYGYDCVPSGDGTATKVVVFDIADRAAPRPVREIDLSGSLLAARRIGKTIHIVATESARVRDEIAVAHGLVLPPYASDSWVTYKSERDAAVERWRADALARVDAFPVTTILPTIRDNGAALPACEGFFRPGVPESSAFTSVLSFDLEAVNGKPAGIRPATIIGDRGVVYASEKSLVLATPRRKLERAGGAWYPGQEGVADVTVLHQFRIGEGADLTGFEASGIAKGAVLNQFSLDRYEDALRVATTSGQTPDPDVHSTLTVFQRSGGTLVPVGVVDRIAPTEDIRSVRFDGPQGYVVTFKKTDPLYVFDLKDPKHPSIAGELKIPGFSTYMHMMDDTHLLTIGYDADDQGSFAWFTGVRLQIFDVKDMRAPALLHTEIIGTRGSSSEALTNHLAFNYHAPMGLLALPMTICEGERYGSDMTFSGLLVYDVGVGGGFRKRGGIAHEADRQASCSNWWTRASSTVKRSIVIDDFVYSLSDAELKVTSLANLAAPVKTVPLAR